MILKKFTVDMTILCNVTVYAETQKQAEQILEDAQVTVNGDVVDIQGYHWDDFEDHGNIHKDNLWNLP